MLDFDFEYSFEEGASFFRRGHNFLRHESSQRVEVFLLWPALIYIAGKVSGHNLPVERVRASLIVINRKLY